MYLGDYPIGGTVDFKWGTNGADGASITRGTNGTVTVYGGNGTTEDATGVTDTEDFDALTGVHHCRVALGTRAPGEYQVVLQAATIDSKTVNAVLAHFSIARETTGVHVGSCTSTGTTTTIIDTALTEAANDHWKGRIVIFLSGTLKGQATDITAFTASSDTLTVTALTSAPQSGDRYLIV